MEELIKLTLINLHSLLSGLDMELDEIYKIIDKYGFILTADAEKFLEENYEYLDMKKFIKFLSLHKDLFIREADISKLIPKKKVEREKIHTKIRIVFDPTKLINQGQGMEDYSSMFKNRFETLSRSIEKSIKSGHVIPLSSLPLKKKPGEVEDAFVIGIIYSKKIWEDKALIELEDYSGRQRIYIFRKREPKLFLEVIETPLDSVIGLHIQILPSGLYTIKDIYYPNVKSYGRRSEEDVYAIFTSDLHIGSIKFHEDEFRNFINILNGHIDDYKLKKIVDRVKYMIIGGDLVEGVGVFPDQKKELWIEDIREQYLTAYKIYGHYKILLQIFQK
jgi:DNA polymerase II small subunit